MKEGLKSVQKIKKEYPNQTVLADLKIMDAGLLEAQIGFDAGADIVSVLGLASQKTLTSVKQTAVKNGREVMVDMINHPFPEKKISTHSKRVLNMASSALCNCCAIEWPMHSSENMLV